MQASLSKVKNPHVQDYSSSGESPNFLSGVLKSVAEADLRREKWWIIINFIFCKIFAHLP